MLRVLRCSLSCNRHLLLLCICDFLCSSVAHIGINDSNLQLGGACCHSKLAVECIDMEILPFSIRIDLKVLS